MNNPTPRPVGGDNPERAAEGQPEATTARSWSYPEDVDYAIDGGHEGIYDGVIVWVLTDGRQINRFRGSGDRREARIDARYPKCEDYR